MTDEPVTLAVADALAEKILRDEMRRVVDFLRAWEMCGRPACRRARRCRNAAVACFDEFAEPIRGCFEELADWDRLDGPYNDDSRERVAMNVFTVLKTSGRNAR